MRRTTLISLALLSALALAGGARAQNDQARLFLHDAIEGDNSEVMLGKLAAERAGSDPVKRFGQMLVDDHAMHREKAMKVAAALGVPDDREPAAEANQERDKLSRLHGGDFDREFARYMVLDHRKDIGEYRKAAKLPGEPGQLAKDTLPTLRKHLTEARRLAS